ncbi:uncharacterized protein G2W53_006556 [Senna tora]|uniref:Uncharacterized protein n=1 Tax=Senna tora TaxID=362788 RepID=A0A834X4W6_9FABA|nr:uncharacterized protein G2W53_006556 [Senna tora]
MAPFLIPKIKKRKNMSQVIKKGGVGYKMKGGKTREERRDPQ